MKSEDDQVLEQPEELKLACSLVQTGRGWPCVPQEFGLGAF